MSTFLKTLVALGLLMFLAGTARAVDLNTSSPQDDIGVSGNPATGGGSSQFGATLRVVGGGSGFPGLDGLDHGYYLYAPVVGDGSISVRLTSFTGGGTSLSRMAGVMVRQSVSAAGGFLNPASAYAANLILPDDLAANRRATSQARTTAGGATTIVNALVGAAGSSPGVGDYVKLTRAGDTFSFAWSNDGGLTWIPYANTVNVPLVGTFYVGLAVTAGDNLQTTTANFRDALVTGFVSTSTLTWNGGIGNWDDANWSTPPPSSPDFSTHVRMANAGADKVTVANDGRALSLTVDLGEMEVSAGRTLRVDEVTTFAPGTSLSLSNGSTLSTYGGGHISQIISLVGDVTIDTAAGLTVDQLAANLFTPGTFTKQGAGTLLLDNSSGVSILAPNTTFNVKAGTLAGKGLHSLGGAQKAILDGGNLSVANTAGPIDIVGAVEVRKNATIDASSLGGASLGPLTLDQVVLTTSGGSMGFDSTNFFPLVTAVELKTLSDTSTGPINLGIGSVTITKTGAGRLIVAEAGSSAGGVATFVAKAGGALVGVHGSNPFGSAILKLDGGELLLANDGLDNPAVFDNALEVLSASTLTGGTGGIAGIGGAPNVRLGGLLNGVNVGSNVLTVRTTDGYSLDIAGALANTAGEVKVTEGTVNLSGGGGGSSLDARVNNGGLSTSALLTFDDVRISNGTLGIGAQLDVLDDMDVSGGIVATVAPLNAAKLNLSGGAVNTGALATVGAVKATSGVLTLGADLNAGSMVVSSASTINTGANQANVTGSALLGATTFSRDAGNPFQLQGADLSDSSTARTITLGGNQVTIVGPPLTTKNLFLDSFNATAGGDAANGVYQNAGGDPRRMRESPNNGVVIPGYTGTWNTNWNQNGGTGSGTSNSVSVPGDLTYAAAGYAPAGVVGQEGRVIYARDDNNMNLGRGLSLAEGAVFEYWISGMMHTYNAAGNDYGELLLNFGPSTTDPQRRVAFGFTADDDMYVRTGAKSATLPDVFTKGTTHLLVGRVQVDRWGDEVVTYYLDPTNVSSLSSLQSTAAYTLSVTDNIVGYGDTALQFRFQGRAETGVGPADTRDYNQGIFFDELRIASGLPGVVTGARGAVSSNGGAPPLDVLNTSVTVTDDATLNLTTLLTPQLDTLTMQGGRTLTVGGVPGVIFNTVTGDGTIVGNVTVADVLSPGNSVGVLNVNGNLTLSPDARYNWEWDGGTGGDVVHVGTPTIPGNLAATGIWTLNIIPGAGRDFLSGGNYTLFTYTGKFKLPLFPNLLVDGDPANPWETSVVSLEVDALGKVLLAVVPEPSTWVLLLTAGVMGLVGYARRRRA